MSAVKLVRPLLALAMTVITDAAASSTPESLHVLSAGGLRVEIATDSRRLDQQYGPRFDRTAIVIAVRLGDLDFVEARGLCDEFGLRGLGVLGFEEAAVGGGEFLKIGVGVLRRDVPGAYTFVRHWPVVESLPVRVVSSSEDVSVEQRSPLRQGYGYRLSKRYKLERPDGLTITYELENTGEKSFSFEQYNHNFLNLGGVVSDALYSVRPAFALPEAGNEVWRLDGGQLGLAAPAPVRGGAYFGVETPGVLAADNRLVLSHAHGGAVEISGDFPLARFAVWATQNAICPETFIRAEVAPGQTVSWRRMYRFASR